MLIRAYRWLEGNRWAGDAAVALTALAGLALVAVTIGRVELAGAILILPLFWRRTAPEAVLVVTTLLCLGQAALYPRPLLADLVIPLVLYAAAAYARNRWWGLGALAVSCLGSVIASVQWSLSASLNEMAFTALAGAAAATVIYLLGLRRRDNRERHAAELRSLRERNALLAASRDRQAELATAQERARIARELHDIVAHSLAVIVVQADGAVAASALKPELAPRALATIAETSREALAEMRSLVAVLRSGSAPAAAPDGYRPPPGLADLDELVGQVRRAGVRVELRRSGPEPTLPAQTGLTVYRVVQESLTNVMKHAGPAATAVVLLTTTPDLLRVEITDDGRGAANSLGADSGATGNGLAGMRERLALVRGTLAAGPRTGGGFRVVAEIPLGRESA